METDKNRGDTATNDNEGGVVDFETAIQQTGWGRYHWAVIIAGSICMMSSGFENTLNAYVLPSAQCDLQMTTQGMGLMNVLFLAGSISSAILSGLLADLFGRKTVLVAAMSLDSLILLVSSCSQSLTVLLAFRYFSGFVSGAPASLVIPYVGEFHAGPRRTTSVCYVGFFWALSWMLAPGIAWLIIPITWSYRTAHFTYNSWRLFVAVFAVPSSIGAIAIAYLPESPRFLLATGKIEEALKVLRRMFTVNTGKPPDEYPMSLAQLFSATESVNARAIAIEKSHMANTFQSLLVTMWRQSRELIQRPFLVYICIFASLMACNMFGGYGLGLWLPELIKRFEEHHNLAPNTTVTVCEQVSKKSYRLLSPRTTLNATTLNESSPATHAVCEGYTVDSIVFRNTLIIGVTCLLGDILYAILANRVSRRMILVVPMLLGSFCSLALYFLRTSTQILIISCIFQMGVEVAYFGVYTVVMENFPTRIRAIAMCTTILAGRVAAIIINLLFGELFDSKCEVPIFVTAAVLFGGVVLSKWVPTKTPPTSESESLPQRPASDGTHNAGFVGDECETKL